MALLLRKIGEPGENTPVRPGDRNPSQVLTPGIEPGPQWCETRALTSVPAEELGFTGQVRALFQMHHRRHIKSSVDGE